MPRLIELARRYWWVLVLWTLLDWLLAAWLMSNLLPWLAAALLRLLAR